MTDQHLLSPNVAILCSTGLGDAVIQMVIANNIASNGFQVTYFSDKAAELSEFQPCFKIKAFPSHQRLIDQLKRYRIILYDIHSRFVEALPMRQRDWLCSNGIGYLVSKGRFKSGAADADVIQRRAGNVAYTELFLQLNTRLRLPRREWVRRSVIEDITEFFRRRTKFEHIQENTGLIKPPTAVQQDVIALHPSSSRSNKNWREHQYKALARLLKGAGLTPVFTVSPDERHHWLCLLEHLAPVPEFARISDLYRFYAGVACFVGNDSGGAHLAAAAGAPIVQIFGRWRRNPGWRASGSASQVVISTPPFCFSRNHWQRGVSVDRVFQAILSTMSYQRLSKCRSDDADLQHYRLSAKPGSD